MDWCSTSEQLNRLYIYCLFVYFLILKYFKKSKIGCINGVGYDSFTEIGEMNVSCVIYAE